MLLLGKVCKELRWFLYLAEQGLKQWETIERQHLLKHRLCRADMFEYHFLHRDYILVGVCSILSVCRCVC